LDTNGNIFGGFTSVQWEFDGGWKADYSVKSFLFTLNIPEWRFALKVEEKLRAFQRYSKWGPIFGGRNGITVYDD
jgi:hypothetical protein